MILSASPAYFSVEVYGGDCNTLNIKRRYNLNFMCNFDLLLYPFDGQFCNSHVRIISASKTYLKFHPKLSTAEYTGNPSLLEYEVGRVSLRHDNSGPFSEAFVKVPLTRLFGYAMLNIFLPSILLLVISYVTLFFSEEVFETRMMASLTNLLVMATLFTQVLSPVTHQD
ncbi:glycine receptor subunit alpha-4-like [Panulirus ornatus]|uniref:glycine receptor subunit alpha-4-like n=1 Tax=Panulirus ornatus TaxID=150431 RepID=UPI003A86E6EF